jgi:lipoprotein-releasing system ATP-binding protein
MSGEMSGVAPEELVPAETAVLALRGLGRTYRTEAGPLPVLRGVDLDLFPGETVGLLAPSGSGKSTLLHLAGLLERPDEGEVYVLGRPAGRLLDVERTALRREAIGFVYQFHHLLGEFTALENVMLPQLIAGRRREMAEARARDLLALVGLEGRLHHLPGKLSGGEQQRVAIARALANGPRLLLADEPTGNLDLATAGRVFEILLEMVRSENAAALIATHNPDLAARMDRRLTLIEGRLHPLP